MRYHRGKEDYYKYLTPSQIKQEKAVSITAYILAALIAIFAVVISVFVKYEGTIFFCYLGLFAACGAILGTRYTLLPLFEIIVGEYSSAKVIVARRKINWQILLGMGIMFFFGCMLIYVAFEEAVLVSY